MFALRHVIVIALLFKAGPSTESVKLEYELPSGLEVRYNIRTLISYGGDQTALTRVSPVAVSYRWKAVSVSRDAGSGRAMVAALADMSLSLAGEGGAEGRTIMSGVLAGAAIVPPRGTPALRDGVPEAAGGRRSSSRNLTIRCA